MSLTAGPAARVRVRRRDTGTLPPLEFAATACRSVCFSPSRTAALAGDRPGDSEANKGCAVDSRRDGASMQQPTSRDARRRRFESREPPHSPLDEHGPQPRKHAQSEWVADHEQDGGCHVANSGPMRSIVSRPEALGESAPGDGQMIDVDQAGAAVRRRRPWGDGRPQLQDNSGRQAAPGRRLEDGCVRAT